MPQINIMDEFYIFLIAINYGLILGGIYDFYRVFRYFSKPKKLLTTIGDLLFWLIITLIIFVFLLNRTDGIIRGFVLLGFIIGYVFYIKAISKYSFLFLKWIFKLILDLISEIIRIISYPLRKIFNLFGKRVNKVGKIYKILLNDAKKYFKITRKKK